MSPRQFSKVLLCSLIASMVMSGVALGTDAGRAVPPEPSKEVRAKMATIHEQMAACLRSDKSVSDCRSEMMDGCKQLMGDHGCPMMHMGKRHHTISDSKSAAAADK